MKAFKRGKPQTKKYASSDNPKRHKGNINAYNDYNDNSLESQRERLIARLKKAGHVTTDEGRWDLGVYCMAPRIFELRKAGYEIETIMERHYTMDGVNRKIARYVLVSEPDETEQGIYSQLRERIDAKPKKPKRENWLDDLGKIINKTK